jgi:protein-tyrosine phosphatase
MPEWVVRDKLARGRRPGYTGENPTPVVRASVDLWLTEVKEFGVRSVICLLADDQLMLYDDVPGGLVPYYEAAGLQVAHVPARDHKSPPLSSDQLDTVWLQYQRLVKPVLVHCSAGVDRTGLAVAHITAKLRDEPS